MPDEICETRVKPRRLDSTRLQVWHIVLSVIGVVFALLLQTGTAIWWAATIQANVEKEKTLRILDIDNEKSARAAEKRAQLKIDDRQDSEIMRNDDRRVVELREINQKLDWIIKSRR